MLLDDRCARQRVPRRLESDLAHATARAPKREPADARDEHAGKVRADREQTERAEIRDAINDRARDRVSEHVGASQAPAVFVGNRAVTAFAAAVHFSGQSIFWVAQLVSLHPSGAMTHVASGSSAIRTSLSSVIPGGHGTNRGCGGLQSTPGGQSCSPSSAWHLSPRFSMIHTFASF